MRPKNRTTIYHVCRASWNNNDDVDVFHVLDSFRTPERADEVKECFAKEAADKGLGGVMEFYVLPSTYYDE